MKPTKAKSPTVLPGDNLVPLESVLCTAELNRRPSRSPDYQTENRALVALAQALADSPQTILQKMAEIMLESFRADSAGFSLLTKEDGGKRFRWPAIAGVWKPHIGGGTPRDFGPCGDVLDRNVPLLFRHFERRYTYFLSVTPPVEECLLVPFYVKGKAVGTIWAIAHNDRRKFDAEDLRQLVSLGTFASSAYQATAFLEALEQRGEALRQSGTELAQRMAEVQKGNAAAQDSRRAALNLMEDAIQSRQALERLNVQLLQSEALFSTLVDQAPNGMYVVDARFRVQQVNSRALPVFSAVQPLIGRDFSEVMKILWGPKVGGQIARIFRHTLETGERYVSPDFTKRRNDLDVEQSYEWETRRVTLPNGQHGVVCYFTDVTARKRAEGAQRRMDVLTASNRKLELEIVRRQAVEKALKKSEQDQTRLLEQSRHMEGQLRRLSHQILHAQEEERKRVSRELHDVIAQTLAGINLHLAAFTPGAAGNPRGLQQKIARTQRLVEKSVDTVHRFARELRPPALDDLGLIPALHAFMKEFTKRTGVRAHLTAFAAIEHLDIARRTVLYRVAHEALNNVARHAQASRLEVTIEKLPDRVCMKIKDDGKSFDVKRALPANGGKRLGLLGMRERLEMVGGSFGVESAPSKGTTVQAQIPLGKALAKGTR